MLLLIKGLPFPSDRDRDRDPDPDLYADQPNIKLIYFNILSKIPVLITITALTLTKKIKQCTVD